jgi:delta 1-pyrroline-5-carboxylate dehydrogenase
VLAVKREHRLQHLRQQRSRGVVVEIDPWRHPISIVAGLD